jgi:ABC-type multidrug transport system ATPase subunit
MRMTVEEHLQFYAMSKGVPAEHVKMVVDRAADDMDLRIHFKKRAGNLSGGNKRKLVIAMSMIATPRVIFLDEPSAGMDPEARRNMWSIIQNVATKSKHSTVILTTHGMDECE